MKQQYKVMDVVNYPVSVGTKFHGDDLQTISSSGTKVVVLDKHYEEKEERSPEGLRLEVI